MRMSPTAIGMFVVPDDRVCQNEETAGNMAPASTPAAMVRKIQSVR